MSVHILRPGTPLVLGNPALRVVTPRRAGGAENWWEAGGATGCVAAYQAKGAASQAASYVNLANPGTYDLAILANGAPAWDAGAGWTWAGAFNTALDTGITPTGQTWTYIVRHAAPDRVGVFGTTGGDSTIQTVAAANGIRVHYANGTSAFVPPVHASGVLATAGRNTYRDGVHEATLSVASWTVPTYPIHIGGRGGHPATVDGSVQAFAIYNNDIGAAAVAAVTAAVQAL